MLTRYKKIKNCNETYTSGYDKKDCILGKHKPFRVKRKVLPTENNASNVMEQPS